MPNPNNVILLAARLNAVELLVVGEDFLRVMGGSSSLYGVSAPVPHGVEGSSRSSE